MKKILIFCIGFYSIVALAQSSNFSRGADNKVKFYQDFISFKGETKPRLDFYIQVPYNAVQFVKTGQGFEAAYSVTVSVFDEENKNLIAEKVWNEKIVAISFELTTSPDNFNLGSRSFELAPGTYSIKTALFDKDSKNEYTAESKVLVRQFSSSAAVSDIMLIAGRTIVEGKTKILPNISRNIITDKDPLSLFFEVYSDTSAVFTIDYEIIDEKENIIESVSEQINLSESGNQFFYNFDSLVLDLGKNYVKVTIKDSLGKILDSSTKAFLSRWAGIPASLTDLDKAIEQMAYFASPEDLNFIKDAEERKEKAKRFVAFWKKQDPNPADEYNPVFNEYYNRVAYANQNFTSYSLEGWRSDRGMVLIILGAPDNIDRHPFEYHSKPYEDWQYYNLNKRFRFVDYTGFGDYRLDPSTPLYGDLYRFRY